MKSEKAKHFGIKRALQSATLGLLIAFLFMTLLAGGNFLWFANVNYKLNIIFGIGILYALSYRFGKSAGYEILIEGKGYNEVGIKYALLTLTLTSFLGWWSGFLQEGMKPYYMFWTPIEDYIIKPFFWIMVVGIIPTILIGIQCGRWIGKSK